MLSSCRTSQNSLRSLVAAAKSQRIPIAQARSSQDLSSSPSCSASTSRSSLSNNTRHFHSSVKRTDGGRARFREYESPSPAVNTPVTPKAAKTADEAQVWLRNAFPDLPLPDDIAMMMITHESWDGGLYNGHNRRLSFLGRRAMKFYISLFLSAHTPNGKMLNTAKVNDLLHTSKLGESAGQSLKLAEIMRWTPAVSAGQTGGRETGLYKTRGVTVEALVGAIYHQHGAQAARAFFSSKILPNLGTFSDREAEELKGAIESEAQAGLATLRNLGNKDASMKSKQSTEREAETASIIKEEDPTPEPSRNQTDLRKTPPLSGARRRTPESDLSLEEGSRSARSASERQSVA